MLRPTYAHVRVSRADLTNAVVCQLSLLRDLVFNVDVR